MSDDKIEIYQDLEKRVEQYHKLELPGQPHMAHMGTSYLISDLWKFIQSIVFDNEES